MLYDNTYIEYKREIITGSITVNNYKNIGIMLDQLVVLLVYEMVLYHLVQDRW